VGEWIIAGPGWQSERELVRSLNKPDGPEWSTDKCLTKVSEIQFLQERIGHWQLQTTQTQTIDQFLRLSTRK
jgi:hypothetical protein